MCKKIQFTKVFCFQGVASKNFFNLGLDVRWLLDHPVAAMSVPPNKNYNCTA